MREAAHGKDWRYKTGCRCQACRDGNTARSMAQKVYSVPGCTKLHRDVDLVAVDRAVRGERVSLGIVERRLVFERLDRMGLSATQIARRAGCCCRTVVRWRAAQRVQ